ncbi:hypothetical protein FKG94_22450 [Exilibacterium tricleocarpae]|uniref:Uncharacterized protein n=1 Tax=Exilibacterium tricleocarpae TaxID=2591008 RepID=A0A545SY69_9GAMM|nr:hypothetical protein [Exilibacterium tricleocarpae]TQV69916.1 hypothetical protein FKG94_22450 [Exilibacterium tricleocarpae]
MAKQKRRNPYACDPIMRKGGVHEKTHKAKRNAAKRAIRQQVRERRGDAPVFYALFEVDRFTMAIL